MDSLMADKVVVRFVKQYPPYIQGDIAGFDAATAKDLIKFGVAEAYIAKSRVAPKNKMASSPRKK
jgi:hypothetical protein